MSRTTPEQEAHDFASNMTKSHRKPDAAACLGLASCQCHACRQPIEIRTFPTGATRSADADKPDFDGFLSPAALSAFGRYMHRHRIQPDGKLRDSDNWQKGIPREQYRKSAFRHFLAWWEGHRAGRDVTEEACALLFNVMGDLHEAAKNQNSPTSSTLFASDVCDVIP